jgi:uncharacterized protein YndB with AHSA1/START domain
MSQQAKANTESPAPQRSVAHGVFTVERVYKAPVEAVYHAMTDLEAKTRWFSGGDGYAALERSIDARPGGREHLVGQWAMGRKVRFDALYFDVVPNQRLVYAYEMHVDDRKISVSLATLEFAAVEGGARLRVTEQGAFLDGFDDPESRERGTGLLLDQLGASLETLR